MNTNNVYGNNYLIKSQRLAGWLMFKGQKLHNIKENLDGSNRNVFFFSNNKRISELIIEYNAGKRRNDKEYEDQFRNSRETFS